jgi:integrase
MVHPDKYIGQSKNPKEAQKFYEFLTKTKLLSNKTVIEYLKYYKDLEPEFASEQEYVNAFIQEKKNNCVVRAMFFNYIQFRNFKRIQLPPKPTGKKPKREIRPIAKSEIKSMKEKLQQERFRDFIIFCLIIEGALRRVEVPTIKVNSFRWREWFEDMDKFCKLVVLGKNNKERVVLISPQTAEVILNRLIESDEVLKHDFSLDSLQSLINNDSLLLAKKNKEPITVDMVSKAIYRSKKILGRGIRPHELRHEMATELERKGASIRDIKNYLGHSKIATTEIYLHKSEKDSVESIERILK